MAALSEITTRGGAEFSDGAPMLPANFYRTRRAMLATGLIEDAGRRNGDDDERRRYVRMSALGRDAARLEARRLQQLLADARTKRLLSTRR
jgi:hypothetical protein